MKNVKIACIALACMALSPAAKAGGILTNTNQNIAFNRNFARDGVIAIDGVYSNPAGVAFLGKGLHLSLNVQNAYQTRTIESGFSIPAMQNTPFYQPFQLNGGNENGIKTFKGKASVPFIPSVQAALNYDNWGFQAGFAFVGGGGQCTFNDGLGSFEKQIAIIPMMMNSLGITTDKPSYGVSSYINGQQYVLGLQLGTTYKFNDNWAVYGGFRFNYILNKYEGNITNISANIAGNDENLYKYFGVRSEEYATKAAAYAAQAAATTDPAVKAQLEAASAQYDAGAKQMAGVQQQMADKYLDCTQTGWGITPIIGVDYKNGPLNIGARLEFTNHLNIENNTKRDDTGLFGNGVNTPNDLPGIVTLGAQYSIMPSLRVMGGWHYFFDKNAKMADDKQKLLSRNTQEYLAGVEWDIIKDLTVSAGGQITNYGLGDGSFLNDMSFVTSSYSIGFGAKFKISKKASVNIAYFWTTYDKFDKAYDSSINLAGTELPTKCTDTFTRTNKVLGAGIDIDF